MKIRDGFVSNSSSSSFVLRVSGLSKKQLNMVENHIEFAEKVNKKLEHKFYVGKYDDWGINKLSEDKWLRIIQIILMQLRANITYETTYS